MDRSHGIARLPGMEKARIRVAPGHRTGPALVASAVVALLVLGITLALLAIGPPFPNGLPERRPSKAASPRNPLPAMSMLGHRDTIDGHAVLDDTFIGRMALVAARIPPAVLAGQAQDPRVRYLAQAFTPGDDPGLTEGWFEDPAAALAFGCAIDADLEPTCMPEHVIPTLREAAQGTEGATIEPQASTEWGRGSVSGVEPSDGEAGADDALTGWRCRPLGLAIGAAVFEPYRCAPSG